MSFSCFRMLIAASRQPGLTSKWLAIAACVGDLVPGDNATIQSRSVLCNLPVR